MDNRGNRASVPRLKTAEILRVVEAVGLDWLATMTLTNQINRKSCRSKMFPLRAKLFIAILAAVMSSKLTRSQAFTSIQKPAHLQKIARKARVDDTSRFAQPKAEFDNNDTDQKLHLGRFYKVQPKWEGTSYSYVRPRKRSRTEMVDATKENKGDETNTESTAGANRPKRRHVELEFPKCGKIVLHQDPSLVADHGVSGTGHTLWSSALAISSYLDANFHVASADSEDTEPILGDRTIKRCVELGAGLGLPSIVAARHGVPHVIATDTDTEPDVMKSLEESMRQNVKEEVYSRGVLVRELDWTYPNDELEQELAPDLIIASDVIWNATRPSWPDLFALLSRLRRNRRQLQDEKDHTNPMVLMGYTQRRLDMTVDEEKEFFDLLRKNGLQAKPIPSAASDNWPLTVVYELSWVDSM